MAQNRQQSNITVLHPKIAQQLQDAEGDLAWKKRYYAKKHHRRRQWILRLGLLATAIFVVQLVIGQVNLSNANRDLTALNAQLTTQKANEKSLEAQKKKLSDPDYLQQLLREKYGYTRAGETLYNLPDQ